MEAFQQRVVNEKTELDTKRQSLLKFFDTDNFCELDETEKRWLERQYGVMCDYSHILTQRIEAFKS